jgi:hypothetical protein
MIHDYVSKLELQGSSVPAPAMAMIVMAPAQEPAMHTDLAWRPEHHLLIQL